MNTDAIIVLCIFGFLVICALLRALINHDKENHEIEITRKNLEEQKRKLNEDRKRFETEMDSQRKAIDEEKEQLNLSSIAKQNDLKKNQERQQLALDRERLRFETEMDSQRKALVKDRKEFEKVMASLQAEIERKKEFYEKEIGNIENLIKKKCDIYPQLAAIMADFLTLHYERVAKFLETKPHPALTESIRIQDLRRETQTILTEKKLYEYRYNYILKLYPNMEDIFDSGFNEEAFTPETEDETDRSRLYLTHEEYSQLSITERNQLALDRYVEQRKSNWQIGRDYEMYIGYKCESLGYYVEYNGIIEKLEDMGRDLIVSKDLVTYIIQCKNWSKEKTIYEKHIFQLYGTYILYKINHPLISCYAVFVTTTSLSKKAHEIANYLDIIVLENIKPNLFPRIKCNISQRSGEKIYHLPFDQQYDNTIIETNKGEFYAMTVAEAEEKGFRRAFRHFGVD